MVKPLTAAHRSGGSTVFRFEGFGDLPGADSGLPLVPIRVCSERDPIGIVVNAIVDTGATYSLLPSAFASDLGLGKLRYDERIETAGGETSIATAVVDLDIVDSYFPSVAHWSFPALPIKVAEAEVDLDLPLVGWDILSRLETCFHRDEGFILMRPARSLT